MDKVSFLQAGKDTKKLPINIGGNDYSLVGLCWAERLAFETEAKTLKADIPLLLLTYCLRDKEGQRFLDNIEDLKALDFKFLFNLIQKANEVNAFTDEDVKQLEKN